MGEIEIIIIQIGLEGNSFTSIHYVTFKRSNMHMYIFHDLFNSNITCLNDLIDYVIRMHVNTYLNSHIMIFIFFF